MTIYPSFQVIVTQVNLFLLINPINELVVVSNQIMTKHNDRFSLRNLPDIIFQPTIYIFFCIFRLKVSPKHRSNNVMRASHIKGIISRTINTLEQFFPVLSFHQVMIADTIKYRTIHIGSIHQLDMRLHSFFIAEIAGMDNKGCLFIGHIVSHITYPITMVSNTGNLGIGNVHIFMTSVFTDPSIIRLQTKVIRLQFAINTAVVFIVGLIS